MRLFQHNKLNSAIRYGKLLFCLIAFMSFSIAKAKTNVWEHLVVDSYSLNGKIDIFAAFDKDENTILVDTANNVEFSGIIQCRNEKSTYIDVNSSLQYLYKDKKLAHLILGSRSNGFFYAKLSTKAFIGKKITKIELLGGTTRAEDSFTAYLTVDNTNFEDSEAFAKNTNLDSSNSNEQLRIASAEPNLICNDNITIELIVDDFNNHKDFIFSGIRIEYEDESSDYTLKVTHPSGEQGGDGDYYTLTNGGELNIALFDVENEEITDGALVVTIHNEKIEEDPIENVYQLPAVIKMNKIGKWRYDLQAIINENIVAEKTIHVLVKGTEYDNSGTGLNFNSFSYGMTPNPVEGTETSYQNFTGQGTGGLDFFIPIDTEEEPNKIRLVKSETEQYLELEDNSRFHVNIDDYGRKIISIEIDGENLNDIHITPEENGTRVLSDDGMQLYFTPKDEVAVRTFCVTKRSVTRASQTSRINNIHLQLSIETGIQDSIQEQSFPLYYDLNGNCYNHLPSIGGLYIKVEGIKRTKILK